jgi:hypothetical protein
MATLLGFDKTSGYNVMGVVTPQISGVYKGSAMQAYYTRQRLWNDTACTALAAFVGDNCNVPWAVPACLPASA